MADPLSIAASIAGLIAITVTAKNGAKQLLAFREAPNEFAVVANELNDVVVLLQIIHEALNSIHDPTPAMLETLGTFLPLLDRLKEQVKSLWILIEALTKSTSGLDGHTKLRFRKWMKKRRHLSELQRSIKGSRENISAALTAIGIIEQHRVYLAIQQVTIQQPHIESTVVSSRTPIAQGYGPIQSSVSFSTAIESFTDNSKHDGGFTPHDDEDHPNAHLVTGDNSFHTQLPADSRLELYVSRANDKCPRPCLCQCHIRSTLSTPRWMHGIVGSLFCGYTSIPLLNTRSCNVPLCRKKSDSFQLTYCFPAWMVNRAICISGLFRDLSGKGASWAVRIPRCIPASHPIWYAIGMGSLGHVQALLASREVTPFDMNEGGLTFLESAINSSRFEIATLLLLEGADCAVACTQGGSLTDHIWKFILGMDIGSKNHGAYPSQRVIALKKHLCKKTGDDDVPETLNLTAIHLLLLHLICGELEQQLRMSPQLIETPDCYGNSPLHWAAVTGKEGSVELLLKYGASVDALNTWGNTPLHIAVHYGHLPCAKLLISAGADVNAKSLLGSMPLHVNMRGSIEMVTFLLNVGADLHGKDMHGGTALHHAAARGNSVLTDCLIKGGADVERRDAWGRTPLLISIVYQQTSTLWVLLKHGASTKARDSMQSTVLYYVARYGGMEMIRMLTAAKIGPLDVDAEDKDGYTARDLFYSRARDIYCVKDRGSEQDEEEAFEALLASVAETSETESCGLSERDSEEDGSTTSEVDSDGSTSNDEFFDASSVS